MGGGGHRRQLSSSSNLKDPSSENLNDAKFYGGPTSSNSDSMGSLGAVNRPPVSRSMHSVPRCNPNSLSVGDQLSFPPSSSGIPSYQLYNYYYHYHYCLLRSCFWFHSIRFYSFGILLIIFLRIASHSIGCYFVNSRIFIVVHLDNR